VVVRGPDAAVTVRRKDRIAGIWINDARARLYGVASYYFLAATRPLALVASRETLDRYGLGLRSLRPERAQSEGATAPYREALVRIQRRKGMYTEEPGGVEMLSRTLFRVHVPLPAAAPRGQYTVQVYLFHGGVVASAQSTPLFVDQVGLERNVYAFAHSRPLLYGLYAVAMAVLLGWLAALMFRKAY
jgi:uncharacterized protein (TIGR02186 family)